ncbi:MAG: ABC transporter ATP-binding protein [Alphaproteobacteria bacterium]|nr:ABC transporter ATP-binding protein [Alphaproteobacteria bacterium]
MTMQPLLELSGVTVQYNRFRALHSVDLACGQGQIVALLGPNGAGKSTILKAAFGLLPLFEGRVSWQGKALKPAPYEMVQSGLSFTPQGKSVFPTLSVKENLETAVHFIRIRKDIQDRLDEVVNLFPALEGKWNAEAGTLSGGQQQMVVLARGLMTRPKLLLLDEPSLGLAPKLVKEVFIKVKEINKRLGTAFVIVEHNLKSLLDIVDYACVLRQGRVISAGLPTDPALRDTIQNIFKL